MKYLVSDPRIHRYTSETNESENAWYIFSRYPRYKGEKESSNLQQSDS